MKWLLCLLASGAFAQGEFVKQELAKQVLPTGKFSAYHSAFNRLEQADWEADQAIASISSASELFAWQERLREGMLRAIGGLPERTPLNAKVVAREEKDGGYVDKVIFESQPGLHVTGLLFLPKSKGKHPAVLVACGHSGNGKGSADYQRGCWLAAQNGMAAFIYDPLEQGERLQVPRFGNTTGHNVIGANAALLGWSMARFRIWDAMRALDYLQSRPDIDGEKLGMMGNSGGGTMTALVSALDERIKSSAPSCYITSLREVCEHMGPQDAEQNIFGQLAFGLNHAALLAMRAPSPVLVNCCHNDMFTFKGTRDSFRVVEKMAKSFGWSDRFQMADVPGPHGWKESLRTASVQWMKHWLADETTPLPEMSQIRSKDVLFSVKNVEHGFDAPGYNVTTNGSVLSLPGARTVYDLMRDELSKPKLSGKSVRELAGIDERDAVTSVIVTLQTNETTVSTFAYCYPDGLALPCVEFVPKTEKGTPVLFCPDKGRVSVADEVQSILKEGRRALVVDIRGTGETGGSRHKFYAAKNPDEGLAVMHYLLGESLVGKRAGDILLCASKFGKGKPVELRVYGATVVAGAHAFAAKRELFSAVKAKDAPLSWSEFVRQGKMLPFADVVNGALRYYDWTDLLK